METIEKWIATEKESSREYAMELKNKEEDLRAKFQLEVVMVKLEKSVKKLELYTEMLSETAQQEGQLWGENPTEELVNHMRLRWRAQETEMNKKLTEAYNKENKALQQIRDDIISTLEWIPVDEVQASGLTPDVGTVALEAADQGQ